MRYNLLKDLNIKNLSSAQKKALAISAGVILVFLIIWFFICLPTKSAVKKLKVELADTNREIDQIESRAGKAKNLDEGIKLLEDNLKTLKNKFPSAEEESIKILANFAQKSGIDVDSIRPAARKELLDENGVPVKIEGRSCYYIAIALSVNCTFSDLIRFTENLEKNLPAFARIQRLIINSSSDSSNILNVNLDLNLYLLAVS